MKTQKEFATDIFKRCQEQIPKISNFHPGGVFRSFIEIVGAFLETITKELDKLLPNRFIQTAQGHFLDLKAEELGVTRIPASKIQGFVIFERNDASRNLTIAKSKIVSTAPDSKGQIFRYKVMDETIFPIEEKECSVLVEAETEGSLYNNQIISELTTPISGITKVSNRTNWIKSPGRDTEEDTELCQRCMAVWRGISGANKGAYIAWVKSVEGVGDIKIIPTPNNQLGRVDVICTGINNIQPSKEFLADIQKVIDTHKPIATHVIVQGPIEAFIDIDISFQIYPDQELSDKKIQEQITTFFTQLFIGKDFEPSALAGHLISSLTEVKSLEVLLPESGQRISEYQIARLKDFVYQIHYAQEI